MKFIGILGKSRVGKDTAANILSSVLGYPIVRLAAPIKGACHALFDIAHHDMEHGAKETVDARYGRTPRELMVWLTTAMQRDFPAGFFFARLLASIPPQAPGVIIPDVRYGHDVAMIRDRGGVVIKVTRSDPPVVHTHEAVVDRVLGDQVLENNGTVESFEKRVMECAQIMLRQRTERP